MAEKTSSSYAAAGVDIDAQDKALKKIKKLVRSTSTPGVLSEVGSFGGMFQLDLEGLEAPVLVASADGVGTKLMVARMAGDFSTVGVDLVNHCVDDILVQGAKPLFFLDYVGAGALAPKEVAQLVEGVAKACKENGCALLGGEMAEMPGFYQPGDYELVGFVVGVVDRARILDGSRVEPPDMLIGLRSSGLHTNGYSLARSIFFDRLGLGLGDTVPGSESSKKLGELLLAPHRAYAPAVMPLLGHSGLHAIAHITGGGITDNLPRVLPKKMHAEVRVGAWEIPPLFHAIQAHGEVDTEEMFRVFNMGVGMILIVDPSAAGEILGQLRDSGERAFPMGTVQSGGAGVVYDFP